MSDTLKLQIEIDSELKEDVEKIASDLETDIQTVIIMFLEKVGLSGKLPFDVKKDRLPAPYSLIIKSEEDLIKKLQKAEKDIEEGRTYPAEEVFAKIDKKLENEKNKKVKDARVAINKIRKAFEGEAERLGLKDEEDVVEMIKEMRREKKQK